MARFTADTADKYGTQGGGGYFTLKDDHDVATVRFLYDDVEDVDGFSVHVIEMDGKERYVNCIREYNEPIDNCPFCRAKVKQMAKMFIPVYNVDEDKTQVWERGKSFFSTLSGTLARYNKNPICSQLFEIERFGKKGDKKTQYQIFRTDDDADDTTLEDYELPNILGGIILKKSAEDMEAYLETGVFPPEEEGSRRSTSRRRDVEDDANEEEEEPRRRESSSRRAGRRTPANSKEF